MRYSCNTPDPANRRLTAIACVVVLAMLTATTACNDSMTTAPSSSPQRAALVTQDTGAAALLTIAKRDALLSPDQQRLLQRARARGEIGEIELAELASSPERILQDGRAVTLSLSPTATAVARIRKSHLGHSGKVWVAGIGQDRSAATLVLASQGLTASIRTSDGLYWVEPIGGRLHAVMRVLEDKLPPEHEPGSSGAVIDTSTVWPRTDSLSLTSPALLLKTGLLDWVTPYIDVLVVYTSAVTQRVYVPTFADVVETDTNESYENSGIGASVRIVHYAQIDYNESGRNFYQHLDSLMHMSNVASLRNQYIADAVVLVVDDDELGGVAYEVLASPSTAFAVVHVGAALALAFAHELGHLQGARHDRYVDNSNNPFQYGHGYVDPNHIWRTIMAYDSVCAPNTCPKVKYWSTPYVNHPDTGQPLGTATYENNARVLNETKFYVRQFRHLAAPSQFAQTNPQQAGQNPSFSWQPVNGAWTHHVYRCISTTGYYWPTCFQQAGNGYNTWTDQGVTIADSENYPYQPCESGRTAYYYLTAEDGTGESDYINVIAECIES